jgi:hypothetical protein
MTQRVGTCSICGGDVMGFRGVWMGVTPPPPDECCQCGAVSRTDVIPMTPRRRPWSEWRAVTTNTSTQPSSL